MSKSPHDPLSREVDRLLAQLAHTGPKPDALGAADRSSGPRAAIQSRSPRVSRPTHAPTRADRIALWARLVLGLALGGVMTQWPYPYACGWPLAGYLGAVATVMLAAAWIALASWKLRSGAAHILSLILFFWGIVLAAEQLLPRIGYAAERASWQCQEEVPMPLTREDVRASVERAGDAHWRALVEHHEEAYPASRPTPGDIARREAERLNEAGYGDTTRYELLSSRVERGPEAVTLVHVLRDRASGRELTTEPYTNYE